MSDSPVARLPVARLQVAAWRPVLGVAQCLEALSERPAIGTDCDEGEAPFEVLLGSSRRAQDAACFAMTLAGGNHSVQC